jgi:TonB family protein
LQTLTFGEGEGKQPKPVYPPPAVRAGQEGTVVVRFSVGTDGRVLAAETSAPSPWGALNREAVRVVREQWRFQPGPVRLHEVAIRFELKK